MSAIADVPDADTPSFGHGRRVAFNIKEIELNGRIVRTSYESPYTDTHLRQRRLPLCDWCLQPQRDATQLQRHMARCPPHLHPIDPRRCTRHHPMGTEIYRDGPIAVFEVDGRTHRVYCQHLCLLGKLFIESKTAHLNVDEFYFYVVVERAKDGYQEKESTMHYNLSCILTLPPYQSRGVGRFMIDFSYLLSRTEGLAGTPEHPVSDQGIVAYRAYWRQVILAHLANGVDVGTTFSIRNVQQQTGIHEDDVVSTLQTLYMIKYYRGKHMIYLNPATFKQFAIEEKTRLQRVAKHGYIDRCDATLLRWQPTMRSSKVTNATTVN